MIQINCSILCTTASPQAKPLNERSGHCDVHEVEQYRVYRKIVRCRVDREVAATSLHVQPPVHQVELIAEAPFRDTDAGPDGEVRSSEMRAGVLRRTISVLVGRSASDSE